MQGYHRCDDGTQADARRDAAATSCSRHRGELDAGNSLIADVLVDRGVLSSREL